MGRVQPYNKQMEARYKGSAPFKSDLKIRWVVKLVLGLIIFLAIYNAYIDYVRVRFKNNFLMETAYITLFLIIADIIAIAIAIAVYSIWDYKRIYMRNKKEVKRNMSLHAWSYLLYTIFRAFSYLSGLVWLITAILFPYLIITFNLNILNLIGWIFILISLFWLLILPVFYLKERKNNSYTKKLVFAPIIILCVGVIMFILSLFTHAEEYSYNLSFFVAWLIISLLSRLISRVIALYITIS